MGLSALCGRAPCSLNTLAASSRLQRPGCASLKPAAACTAQPSTASMASAAQLSAAAAAGAAADGHRRGEGHKAAGGPGGGRAPQHGCPRPAGAACGFQNLGVWGNGVQGELSSSMVAPGLQVWPVGSESRRGGCRVDLFTDRPTTVRTSAGGPTMSNGLEGAADLGLAQTVCTLAGGLPVGRAPP